MPGAWDCYDITDIPLKIMEIGEHWRELVQLNRYLIMVVYKCSILAVQNFY